MTSSEREFQSLVVETARVLGWMVYHTFDSRRSSAGFPDLVLVRRRLVFAELKRDGGRLSGAQKEWMAGLRAAGAECYVWRPADFDALVEVLR